VTNEVLESLYGLLGRVVLLPIPLGQKGPKLPNWQTLTWADTQHPDYQKELANAVSRGGNIGVLLGPASERLVSIDIDDAGMARRCLELNPPLEKTLRTQGKRGCQFWLRMSAGSDYPNGQAVYALKDDEGREYGEWRCGGAGKGAQTVIYGMHPEGMRYRTLSKSPPREIEFSQIVWPAEAPKDEAEGNLPEHPLADEAEPEGDRRLKEEELVAEISQQCGPPAFFNTKRKMTGLNERFWAKLAAAEGILIHEPDEREFYSYDAETGLYVTTTDDVIRERFASRIYQAAQEWKGYGQLERFTGNRVLAGAIAHLRGVTESRAFSEPPCTYIHCSNCVLELTDNGFIHRDFSPRFKSRNRSPVAYEPGAKCPKFQDEVLGVLKAEDKELVQKVFGGMLLGYNIAQKILLLHGIGNTGKTTLALILQGIVGSENISELRTAHLDQRFEIGRFLGKSLLIGVDVDSDFLAGPAISRLKGLVGGDFLDAERKSSNSNFRLHGRFNVLVTSNSRLRIKLQGDQSAWRRRLLLVPYETERTTQTIRDFHQVILRAEAPGILLWGLEGLAKLRSDLDKHGDI
jgi:P4 family phage/plasmid primase-like protien